MAEPERVFGAQARRRKSRASRPGDQYDSAELDDLRRALIQTSLVSSATIKPVPSADPGMVDLAVALEPAPPRTIAGELGYGTGEGARAEVSWTHRNLFPPEGALTLRGVLGTQEQLASVAFRRNNFRARDRVLNAQIVASNLKRDAYRAKTLWLSGVAGAAVEHLLPEEMDLVGRAANCWLPTNATSIPRPGWPRRRTYFIGAIAGQPRL